MAAKAGNNVSEGNINRKPARKRRKKVSGGDKKKVSGGDEKKISGSDNPKEGK